MSRWIFPLWGWWGCSLGWILYYTYIDICHNRGTRMWFVRVIAWKQWISSLVPIALMLQPFYTSLRPNNKKRILFWCIFCVSKIRIQTLWLKKDFIPLLLLPQTVPHQTWIHSAWETSLKLKFPVILSFFFSLLLCNPKKNTNNDKHKVIKANKYSNYLKMNSSILTPLITKIAWAAQCNIQTIKQKLTLWWN